MRIIVMAFVALCVGFGTASEADVLSSKQRSKVFKSQTKVLDNRTRLDYNSSINLEGPQFYTPTKWGVLTKDSFKSQYSGRYLNMARDAARRYGVPESLFLRLVQQESGWNAAAKSHKGAIGLAQLMPGTARGLRVNPYDPYENLDGGARYLAQQYRTFGSWRLALAAYNAGPEAVRKYGGVPPYKETKNYVRVILGS